MDFFQRVGPVSIGSRTRLLSERLLSDARQINLSYGSDLRANWFSVLYLLKRDGPTAVSQLAESVGQSHPAVVRIVNELVKAGLAERTTDPDDRRRSLVGLTDTGQEAGTTLTERTIPDVAAAVAEVAAECTHDLWAALEEWETALQRHSLLDRTREARRARAARELSIIPFENSHQLAWHDLNEAWISQYFTMETEDYHVLLDPRSHILDKGGAILIAEYHGQVVGTCALIPMDHPEYRFELAKMCIAPEVQGLGFGHAIGLATLQLAREQGAKSVYLESNKRLTAALSLYRKLGFRDVEGRPSPYSRADVRMAVML